MRQFVRGERAPLSDLAAIHHLWDVSVSLDAPVYIVDFFCLGLDENGEVFDENFIIHLNRPEAPRGAIRLDNASNNGAFFALALELLPPQVRRLVFTATVGENPIPGGLVGAAFSLLGVNAEIGAGHLILATPVAELAFFEFSGQDFEDERTLVIGELYLRDEWRFVAAGQPLKSEQTELGSFLRTLTDGPTPAPRPIPPSQRAGPPLAAPARPPRPATPPPVRNVPRPAAPVLAPPRASAPVAPPRRAGTPLAPAPATVVLPAPPSAPSLVAATPILVPAPPVAPVAPLNLPQTVPPGGKLQDLIDAAAHGSTLILQRGEYQGPITLAKPLSLEGQGSAIWVKAGPVVTLASPHVSLHDLDLEITVSREAADEKGVALQAGKSNAPLELDAVQLGGRLAGLGEADGTWKLPRALDLGAFAARAANDFRFSMEVPTAATLSCSVGGIEISPSQIGPGTHQITLRARDMAPDTLLVGQFEVRASGLILTLPLQGTAQNDLTPTLALEIGGA